MRRRHLIEARKARPQQIFTYTATSMWATYTTPTSAATSNYIYWTAN